MAQGLPVFPPFNVTEAAVDSRWKKWLGRLEIMLIGMDVKDAKRKRALLLHYAGEDISTTLPDIDETFDAAKQALTQYFAPQKSTEFEVYKFRQAKQESRPAIQKWLDSSKGTRHIAGHKLPGLRPNKPRVVL